MVGLRFLNIPIVVLGVRERDVAEKLALDPKRFFVHVLRAVLWRMT